MARKGKKITLVKGRVIRVTDLDNCARVIYGEYSQAVSDGVTTVAFTANTTETEEINVPNFNGKPIFYEPAVATLAGYGSEITFGEVDPEVFSIITGQPVVLDYSGNVIGLDVDTSIEVQKAFALEVWAGAGAADVCDDPNAQGAYGYVLIPFLQGGTLGDFTVENGLITFTLSGATTREGNAWGVGPYDVMLNAEGVPSPFPTPLSKTAALRMIEVAVAPPTPFVGARPLLNPSGANLTSVAGIQGDTNMEVEFATTPAATASVYWEFGDGTWDYVAAPGSASHVYTDPGTYTARATQNGRVWRSVSVTVPFP